MAFERLLRMVRRPYVSVDETRRALARDESLKSMDFIVYSPQGTHLLVDVKGRLCRTGGACWDSWATPDDIRSLLRWQEVFGAGFRAVLLFAYALESPRAAARHSVTWELRGRRYAFYGVWAEDYSRAMQTRSRSWDTVCLPARAFRELRQPVLELL